MAAATTPSPASALKRHHFTHLTGRQDRFLRATFREHGDPMLDEIRRVAVDLHPRQAVAKDAAMCQRPLRPDVRAEIAQTTLKAENLPQSFDVTAR